MISEAVPSAEGRATHGGRWPTRPAKLRPAVEQLGAAGAVAEAEREEEGGGDERAAGGDDDLGERGAAGGSRLGELEAICVMVLCITE